MLNLEMSRYNKYYSKLKDIVIPPMKISMSKNNNLLQELIKERK